MIKPHPESDLSMNILALGSEIIEMLSSKREYVLIENIMEGFLKKSTQRTADLFFDTLTFLYITEVIKYKGYKVRLKKNGITQETIF